MQVDQQKRKRANRWLALGLALVAVAVYLGFILMSVYSSG